MTENPASSQFQLALEKTIIKEFNKHSGFFLKPPEKASLLNGISFHFDFTDNSGEIIGEIYSCKFPLKPGHLRKIKSDILKLITYEKLSNKEHMKKYLVLTIQKNQLKTHDISPEKILAESDTFSLFGHKSWLSCALSQFNIQVFYYILSTEEEESLLAVRRKQKVGMSLPTH